MTQLLRFGCRAYDTTTYPFPREAVTLFNGHGPVSRQRVTAKTESEAINWILGNPFARELLLEELRLPGSVYAQAGVIEPLLPRNRGRKPGDIDLILVPNATDPRTAISLQAKRVKVTAVNTHRDEISNRHLGNLTDVVEQANGSRELGFCLNYVLVIIETDGVERSGFNFLHRGTTSMQFKRIYNRVMNSPLHDDVGFIIVEISQPTHASIDHAGLVAIRVDRTAKPIAQPSHLSSKVHKLVSNLPTL